jgi:hypothetical protein
MKHALPPLTNDLIDAFTASAGAWLLRLFGVVARIGALNSSRRLHRLVAQLERGVEAILFLRAAHRFGPSPRPRRIPRAAPPGFRRNANRRLRLFFRNAGVRARKADLATRLSHVAAALANPAPHVAYFFKRLLKGLAPARLIPTAPAAHALAGAPTAPFADDTS